MSAGFYNSSAIEHKNLIRITHAGQSVRYYDHGFVFCVFIKIVHNYDHSFPLRYKAQKGYEIRVRTRSIQKYVLKYYLRKQTHYTIREGE